MSENCLRPQSLKVADPNSNLGLLIPIWGLLFFPQQHFLVAGIDIINNSIYQLSVFPGGAAVKNLPANAKRLRFDPWVGKIHKRRK